MPRALPVTTTAPSTARMLTAVGRQMVDADSPRAWTSDCWWRFGSRWGCDCERSHRGVLSRAHISAQYDRSLRPCAARFAAAQGITGNRHQPSTLLAMPRAADLFVQCLENEGVRYVFGIPGEETLDLND